MFAALKHKNILFINYQLLYIYIIFVIPCFCGKTLLYKLFRIG
jgi:hypothetical protein